MQSYPWRAGEQYLTFEHDEFTMKPTLDKDNTSHAAVLETLTTNAQNAARAAEKPLPQQEYPAS